MFRPTYTSKDRDYVIGPFGSSGITPMSDKEIEIRNRKNELGIRLLKVAKHLVEYEDLFNEIETDTSTTSTPYDFIFFKRDSNRGLYDPIENQIKELNFTLVTHSKDKRDYNDFEYEYHTFKAVDNKTKEVLTSSDAKEFIDIKNRIDRYKNRYYDEKESDKNTYSIFIDRFMKKSGNDSSSRGGSATETGRERDAKKDLDRNPAKAWSWSSSRKTRQLQKKKQKQRQTKKQRKQRKSRKQRRRS